MPKSARHRFNQLQTAQQTLQKLRLATPSKNSDGTANVEFAYLEDALSAVETVLHRQAARVDLEDRDPPPGLGS